MLRICYRLCFAAVLLASAGLAQTRVSEYRQYIIPLSSWRPTSDKTLGVMVKAQINGNRPVRLILDTGADGIVLWGRAAQGLDVDQISKIWLTGPGGGAPQVAKEALARTVRIDKLELTNCPIRIAPRTMTQDADGVIGMNLFKDFQIRLDARSLKLTLEAFANQPVREAEPVSHLLFVRAKINGSTEGMFLVDTGSALTSLASDIPVPAAASGDRMQLNSASGPVSATKLEPVWFEIEGERLMEREPIAMDLKSLGSRNGVKVAGILGYSVLSRIPVTFNYRDGVVGFGSR